MNPTLPSIIEALLFVAGEPMTLSKLAGLTDHTEPEVTEAVQKLQQVLRGRGIAVLQKDESVTLVTVPHLASYVEKLIKEELLGDLSKAALEALTIIAYRHPITRSEVDYIRGVNSSFTMRNLTARGLIERLPLSEGKGYRYQPTLEFMKFLGISSFHELPEFESVQKELKQGIENVIDEEA